MTIGAIRIRRGHFWWTSDIVYRCEDVAIDNEGRSIWGLIMVTFTLGLAGGVVIVAFSVYQVGRVVFVAVTFGRPVTF